jgi:hypothetical protein
MPFPEKGRVHVSAELNGRPPKFNNQQTSSYFRPSTDATSEESQVLLETSAAHTYQGPI